MGIAVTCSHCNSSFRVKDEHAGKRGRCPKCRNVLQIPAISSPVADATAAESPRPGPAAAVSPPPVSSAVAATQVELSRADLQREVLAAFQGDIEPVKVPATYRFGIILVAVVMVVLPLVYVALIGLVGYVVYLHAIHDTGLLNVRGGRASVWVAIIYVAPMIVGAILILFMIKPLFARPVKQGRIRSLTRRSDPLLFAFVDRVCAAVGAPQPKRIDVDPQVNASASFRRGFLSMLGNDLVLTIGIPLVAGLNLRQFAGVLAHEFGHFTQGAGMRLTYVIRSISHWFTRVVYERDEWDQRLAEWAEGTDIRIGFMLYGARLFVWLTRRILWVLMMIGHLVAGFMLRQMEYDADRHEARLAGSDVFESTARQLTVLTVATEGAHADLDDFYREGRLGDNLPRLIMANVGQIPAEVHEQINRHIQQTSTGLLDSHPAAKDRMASARRENAEGIFQLERPASVLFTDFNAVSRNVTEDFYRAIFGSRFKPTDMHPVEDLLARQGKEQQAGEALGRYFQGAFTTLRPLRLPSTNVATPSDPRQALARLKQARQWMLQVRSAYVDASALFDHADTQTVEADQAQVLLKAGFKIQPKAFTVPLSSRSAARDARGNALARQQQIGPQLEDFERVAGERLFAALELLHVPEVAGKIENARQCQQQCERMLPALALLTREHRALLEFRNTHAALAILLNHLEGNEQDEALIRTIQAQMTEVNQRVCQLSKAMSDVAYPFDHAKGEISIGDYAVPELPGNDDLGAIYGAGEAILDKLPGLYARIVRQLAAVAEQVESVVGLPPLTQPPAAD